MHLVPDRQIRLPEESPHPAAVVPGCCQVRIEQERAIDHGSAVIQIADNVSEPDPAESEGNRVLLAQLGCTPSQSGHFCDVSGALGCPAVRFAPVVAPDGHAMGRCEIGIQFDRPMEQPQRLCDRVLGVPMNERDPPQIAVIGIKTLGRLAFGALDLGLLQLGCDRTHHA
jgi:hypothetical protein